MGKPHTGQTHTLRPSPIGGWRAYRLAVVFGLDRRMADLMYEGGLPVDDEIAAWLSEAASLLDTVP